MANRHNMRPSFRAVVLLRLLNLNIEDLLIVGELLILGDASETVRHHLVRQRFQDLLLPLNSPLGRTLVAGRHNILFLLLAELRLAREAGRFEVLVDGSVVLVNDRLVIRVLDSNMLPHLGLELLPLLAQDSHIGRLLRFHFHDFAFVDVVQPVALLLLREVGKVRRIERTLFGCRSRHLRSIPQGHRRDLGPLHVLRCRLEALANDPSRLQLRLPAQVFLIFGDIGLAATSLALVARASFQVVGLARGGVSLFTVSDFLVGEWVARLRLAVGHGVLGVLVRFIDLMKGILILDSLLALLRCRRALTRFVAASLRPVPAYTSVISLSK
mmetsp:Transcript_5194/g.8022  ORF Transcript_5194/g.8022 Transcript_5194/m.8022 type:complete len:328 (-) Transcript_5194:2621-3604(-)